MKCKNCQKEVKEEWKTCPYCGQELEQDFTCPNCNKKIEPDWEICPFCQTPLNEDEKMLSDKEKEFWKSLDENWKKVLAKSLKKEEIGKDDIDEIFEIKKIYSGTIKLKSFEPVRYLKKLEYLDCTMNEISSLSPLQELTNLEYIECGGTKISSLEPLRNLKKLNSLGCYSTKIKSIEPLFDLNNMELLFAQDNDLPNSEIEKFKKLNPDCHFEY